MDWYLIAIIGVMILALLVFVIRRNQKDKKELENKLNQDYRKPREGDVNDPNAT